MPKMTLSALTTAAVSDISLNAALIKAPILTLSASALTTAEVVTLETYVGNETFATLRDSSNNAITLSGTNLQKQINNPGVELLIDKPATATACQVSVSWPSVTQRG